MNVRTAAEARAELARKGISITQWARANDLNQYIVFQVLQGKAKCVRGESHRAAVLLGMKDGEIANPEAVKGALETSDKAQAA